MGHFSYTCKLSGLPITSSTPAVLIVMKLRKNRYDCSDDHLKKYGTTCLVSNDATQVKFQPVWFPIHANYNDYGGMEGIKKDDNVEVLEKYYGLSIEKLIDIVTSGRKDDGYDGALGEIKKGFNLPDDYIEGEDWFDRYQRLMNLPMPCEYPDISGKYNSEWLEEGYEGWTVMRDGKKIKATKEQYDADFKLIHDHYAKYKEWLEENPDPTDDYGNPQYEERYKELLSYSGMWVHGEFYDKLTNKPAKGGDYDKLDLGTPELLNALGFKKLKTKSKDKRYKYQYKKGNLTINSDDTWINVKDESIYTLPQLKEYCVKMGEDVEIDTINIKDRTEQIYDYVMPNVKSIGKGDLDKATEAMNEYDALSQEEKDSEKGHASLLKMRNNADFSSRQHPMFRTLRYLLLNDDEYRFYNPMTPEYFKAVKQGKLRDSMVRFWRFNYYMYCTGRYYDIVGTSPQDGEHEAVMKVLDVAKEIINVVVEERKKWRDELMDS